MLVILTDKQILSVKEVCPGCLMADRSGLPRWRQGKLCCGNPLADSVDNKTPVYECQMGFHLRNIE
jgi:hypothetical protein